MKDSTNERSTSERQVLAINGGSSSIKFALFTIPPEGDAEPRRTLSGQIERVGQPGTTLVKTGPDGRASEREPIVAADHRQAAEQLIDKLHEPLAAAPLVGIGHRIVHGGIMLVEHQRLTSEVL